MVVKHGAEPADPSRATLVRIVKWALMLVALFWVVVYRAAQDGGGVPEFVYVNF